MNNAKMWLVVKPTVGVPLFLSAVAIGSFAVHVAVLTNTSWVSDFLSGKPLGTGDQTAALIDQERQAVQPASMQMSADGERMVIIMPDGRRAVAVIEQPATLAKADILASSTLK